MMKASFEKVEANKVVLTVEVDSTKVAEGLDQAFKKVVKKANVPGFRKGKVPRALFEQRFGVESLYQDALDILLPEAYEAAVAETGIEPVDRPEVDIEQLEQGQALIFKATVIVKPEVKLGDYKGLEVAEKDFSVKAEAVSEELTRMQKQQAVWEPVEEGTVAQGDRTVIDFEGFVDGVAFEGGKGEQYSLDIGSNSFIPGFEDQVVGMGLGEEKDVEVTFPEEYHAVDLAGKAATFRVKLHEMKRQNLPEMNDDFAQDVSDFETLAELQADVEKNMAERAEKDKENYIRTSVVDLASEKAEVEVPAVMVDGEVEQMLRNFEQNLSYQGLNLELYTQFTGQSVETLKEQFKVDAEKKVRADLVVEAVAKAENIEVSEEDIDQEIAIMAEEMKRDAAEIRTLLEAQGSIEQVRTQLRLKKAVDLLVLNSKVTA
ncbi:trigger factor [Baia soyae]|uniref:Trigger factor n=2 Tax=Baia soyae TaxID=1544746 RepID=A0A4V2SWD1_9BACL|nr:trigger factor [Baia soyae]